MKKQAKHMQAQLGQIQEQMQAMRMRGEAGNGLVAVTVNGEKEIVDIAINPECVDPEDVEGLQDLLLEAAKAAYAKVGEQAPALF